MDPEGQERPDLTTAPLRPLLVRPGARFRCEGDGLCCSDIHALGPVARPEIARLRAVEGASIARHRRLKLWMVQVSPHPHGGQACVFLRPHGCAVYDQRPATCRRFPFGLTATPAGLRVTTDHRCPCRTLGPRPPLDPAVARASLADAAGRLTPDGRAPARIPLSARSRVGFDRYLGVEAPLLAALQASDDPLEALGCEPFPPLDGARWRDVAHLLRGYVDGSSGGEALGWFGDVLLTMQGDGTRARRARPWAWSFDRAEARGAPEPAARVLGDWAADVLWSLDWLDHGSFELARLELATRLAVATEISGRLAAAGLRPDRAAAEAVMMAEMAGALPLWGSVMVSIKEALKPGAAP